MNVTTDRAQLARFAPELLTVREAAGILRIHTDTVRRWMDKGLLRYVRIGPSDTRRRVRLLRCDVEAEAAGSRTTPQIETTL